MIISNEMKTENFKFKIAEPPHRIAFVSKFIGMGCWSLRLIFYIRRKNQNCRPGALVICKIKWGKKHQISISRFSSALNANRQYIWVYFNGIIKLFWSVYMCFARPHTCTFPHWCTYIKVDVNKSNWRCIKCLQSKFVVILLTWMNDSNKRKMWCYPWVNWFDQWSVNSTRRFTNQPI